MDSKVASFAAVPDPTYGQKPAPQPRPDPGEPSIQRADQQPDPADLRLIIEEDKATNSYIYKTVNRLTGEVVQQLPRDKVLMLGAQVEYVAGAVVRTTA